jgi:cell cycle checkpoint protein
MTPDNDDQPPLFSAVTSSARQLFSVLRCCGFQPRAELELLPEGVKVTVEDSRVMQGQPPKTKIKKLKKKE